MGLESATFINDLTTTNPVATDQVSQGDDHLRLLKTVLKATFPNATKAFRFPVATAKTTNYTLLAADHGSLITMSAAGGVRTFTLPSLAAGDAGWYVWLRAINLTNSITINGTINGVTNYPFSVNDQTVFLWWSGSLWYAASDSIVNIVGATALTAPAVDDSLLVYDLSATANRKISFQDFLKVLNLLTEDVSPVAADDFLLTYDASASAVKKSKIANVAPSAGAASDTASGIIELAIQSEMEAATDAVRAVVPSRVHFHPGVAKCWAKFNTGATLDASYNMTSITDNGVGDFTATIGTDFSSANWAGVFTPFSSAQTLIFRITAQAAGTIRVVTNTLAGSVTDPTEGFFFVGFGDHA